MHKASIRRFSLTDLLEGHLDLWIVPSEMQARCSVVSNDVLAT
jgi:hypothetical protein